MYARGNQGRETADLRVIGEESFVVERVGKHLCYCSRRHGLAVLVHVHHVTGLEQLLKRRGIALLMRRGEIGCNFGVNWTNLRKLGSDFDVGCLVGKLGEWMCVWDRTWKPADAITTLLESCCIMEWSRVRME